MAGERHWNEYPETEDACHRECDDAREWEHVRRSLLVLTEQEIAETHQLTVITKAKLDAPAATVTHDCHVRAESFAQPRFEVTLLRRERSKGRRLRTRRCDDAGEALQGAYRQSIVDGALRERAAVRFGCRQEGARVTGGETAIDEHRLDCVGEPEQSQRVCNRGAALSEPSRELFLR